MADDFDVESLLEATYNRDTMNAKNNNNWNDSNKLESSDGSGNDDKHSQSLRNGSDADDHKDSGGNRKHDDGDESDSNVSANRKKNHKHKDRRHRSRSRHGSESKHKSKSSHKRTKSRSPDKHKSSKKSRHERSKSKSQTRTKSKSRGHSKSKSSTRIVESRHKSTSSSQRSRSEQKKQRSRSNERRNVISKSKDRPPSANRDKRKRHSLTPLNLPGRRTRASPPFPTRYRRYSPTHTARPPTDDLSPEERDARTIFVMQLSQRIRAKDLEEFFSSVGKVRDVRLITCNKTRRFKGIAYIEFLDPESVTLALGLNGQKLLDIPIIVQPTQAEKNRVGNTMPNVMNRTHPGPTRLYVGSLHFNITEDMLRGIFEPFGKIDSIQLVVDPESGRSKGYGFVTYHNSDDAKKALEQMNGFELAGRPMKVNNVSEKHDFASQGTSSLDTDELDRAGIDLGATGRLQLMYKLAEGTGMEIPPAAATALNLNQLAQAGPTLIPSATPPIATQCFMLSNMFDPTVESQQNWDVEIRDDVIEECNKHGGCVHVYVDKSSTQGNVYVKCFAIATAVAAVNSLHGRWFGGRIITAAYVPVLNYHNLFPETITGTTLLTTSRTT